MKVSDAQYRRAAFGPPFSFLDRTCLARASPTGTMRRPCCFRLDERPSSASRGRKLGPALAPTSAGLFFAYVRTEQAGAYRVGHLGASSLSPPSPRCAWTHLCPAVEPNTRAGLFLCPALAASISRPCDWNPDQGPALAIESRRGILAGALHTSLSLRPC